MDKDGFFSSSLLIVILLLFYIFYKVDNFTWKFSGTVLKSLIKELKASTLKAQAFQEILKIYIIKQKSVKVQQKHNFNNTEGQKFIFRTTGLLSCIPAITNKEAN
jgi:hypothetical protein